MRAYSLRAPAKINLYLEIIGDRPDGFHELVMILQSIDLADRVDIRANGTQEIRLFCNSGEVPQDQTNLAYRAAALIAKSFPDSYDRFGGVDIAIDKQIPVGAGLAGGSGNAAAVLVGMDLLWSLGLTQSELQDLGAQLGSDIPFCIAGGTALATGRGEKLDTLPVPENLYVVLAKYRSLSVSTAWAYQTYRKQFGANYLRELNDLESRRQQVHSGNIMAAIAKRDSGAIGQHLRNDLEKVVLPEHPKVAQLRDVFQQQDVLGTMMSGSGPTVFALVDSQTKAEQVRDRVQAAIKDSDLALWVTQCCNAGVQIV